MKKRISLVLVSVLLLFFAVSATETSTLEPLPKIKVKHVKQEKADALGKELLVEGSNVKKLLKKGANANVLISEVGDETPFMTALSRGDFATADLMIAAGTDINYRTQSDSIPLIAYYLEQNKADIATYLYYRGAALPDPTESFSSMNFPGLVASAGALEILKGLQKGGEDILQLYRIQKGDTVATYTLLAFAVFGDQKDTLSKESIDLIRYLIEQKINVNAPLTMTVRGGDSLSATALTLAAMAGEEEVIELLLKAGADLNSATTVVEQGHTMIFDLSVIPILNSNYALLKQLIQGGASPNGKVIMKQGNKIIASIPLMVYAVSLANIEVVTLLNTAKASLDQELISNPALGIQTQATTVIGYIAESKNSDIQKIFSKEIADYTQRQSTLIESDSSVQNSTESGN